MGAYGSNWKSKLLSLGARERRVGAQPNLGLSLIAPRAKDVKDGDDGHDDGDVALDAEILGGVPLVGVVPLRVRATSRRRPDLIITASSIELEERRSFGVRTIWDRACPNPAVRSPSAETLCNRRSESLELLPKQRTAETGPGRPCGSVPEGRRAWSVIG